MQPIENSGGLTNGSRPVRILHLEDSDDDAELVKWLLESAGITCEIFLVSNKVSFEAALAKQRFDLILCDHSLPGYDGVDAWRLARHQHPETPVIMVSGRAVESPFSEGAEGGPTDYIRKEKLARLVPAIRRALAKAETRKH